MNIVVTGPEGDTVQTLRGGSRAGLNRVTWNLRGPQPEPEEPGPYAKKEQERIRARALEVQDSLLEAGWSENELRPIIQRLTGEATGFPFGGFGGGGFGGDPEAFRERPGETPPGSGGGGFNFGRMLTLVSLIVPDASLGSLFRRFGGGGGAPLVEPGVYTLTMTVGERTYTQPLTVERVGEVGTEALPGESDAALLEWFFRWMAAGR